MNCWKSNSVLWLIWMALPIASSDSVQLKARQSGDLQDTAMYAVDNDPSTCSLAAEDNPDLRTVVFGWLQVDLGNSFLVTSVTLTNSNSVYDSAYLQNFAIFVSESNSTDNQWDHFCATLNNGSAVARGATITFTCNNPLIGRYVTIRRQGGYRQDAISICEVSISYNLSGPSISTTTATSTSTSTSSSTAISTVSSTSTSTTTSTSSLSAMSSGSSSLTVAPPGFTISASPSSMVETLLTNRVAGLTVAVIVLGILLALTVIALALLVVNTLRKRNQSKGSVSLPTPTTDHQPYQESNYEKLRHEIGARKSNDASIPAAQNFGEAAVYEEV